MLGSGKRFAAGYLRSLQMLCSLFPSTGDGAEADKLLPGVKVFPSFMLNGALFTLVWGQAISHNLRTAKIAVNFPSAQLSLCVSYHELGRANTARQNKS